MLITRPERVVITEGVTDCISLMERDIPAVSPVTVRIREADWERLDMIMTAMIYAGICEELDSRLMLFPSPEPEFFPAPLTG